MAYAIDNRYKMSWSVSDPLKWLPIPVINDTYRLKTLAAPIYWTEPKAVISWPLTFTLTNTVFEHVLYCSVRTGKLVT